ncbi:hypothetical protein [Enterococcus sp. DIV0840c]
MKNEQKQRYKKEAIKRMKALVSLTIRFNNSNKLTWFPILYVEEIIG